MLSYIDLPCRPAETAVEEALTEAQSANRPKVFSLQAVLNRTPLKLRHRFAGFSAGRGQSGARKEYWMPSPPRHTLLELIKSSLIFQLESDQMEFHPTGRILQTCKKPEPFQHQAKKESAVTLTFRRFPILIDKLRTARISKLIGNASKIHGESESTAVAFMPATPSPAPFNSSKRHGNGFRKRPPLTQPSYQGCIGTRNESAIRDRLACRSPDELSKK